MHHDYIVAASHAPTWYPPEGGVTSLLVAVHGIWGCLKVIYFEFWTQTHALIIYKCSVAKKINFILGDVATGESLNSIQFFQTGGQLNSISDFFNPLKMANLISRMRNMKSKKKQLRRPKALEGFKCHFSSRKRKRSGHRSRPFHCDGRAGGSTRDTVGTWGSPMFFFFDFLCGLVNYSLKFTNIIV